VRAQLEVTPYWKDTSYIRRFPRVEHNLHADVVVIGGGLTGISTAYLLHRAGRRVVLVERRRCADMDTGHTTGHLACVTDTPLSTLVDVFGDAHAQASWDAGLAAIAEIDAIVRREKIECDFTWVPGYLHAPVLEGRDHQSEYLRKEAATAVRLGFDAEYLDRVPYVDRPGVRYEHQARFDPRRYLAALLDRLEREGARVFEHSSVDEVQADPLVVMCGDHRITCEEVVVATHNPIVGASSVAAASILQSKLALYTSYAVAGRVPSDTLPDALFWDTSDPYVYCRIEKRRGFDSVIVGGADHKTGQEPDTIARLDEVETIATRFVPELEITHRWSGQVIETTDGLPFIGAVAPHQFASTGFGGNGMTFGTLAAIMARDALTGRTNPWVQLFAPGRTTLKGAIWDYLRENKDYPYYLIRDRFAGVEGRSLRALPRGSGRVLVLDGQRVAAFRDDDGSVTKLSSVCTHLGCQVHWNPAERTWDCPCHGSRFSPAGKVLAGPAEEPLNPVG
jgi:glycine/D-amino acid oxidase-like deaminating enzyme/nitrite reductase/ring-hydroxylating ferredoxin subunit